MSLAITGTLTCAAAPDRHSGFGNSRLKPLPQRLPSNPDAIRERWSPHSFPRISSGLRRWWVGRVSGGCRGSGSDITVCRRVTRQGRDAVLLVLTGAPLTCATRPSLRTGRGRGFSRDWHSGFGNSRLKPLPRRQPSSPDAIRERWSPRDFSPDFIRATTLRAMCALQRIKPSIKSANRLAMLRRQGALRGSASTRSSWPKLRMMAL